MLKKLLNLGFTTTLILSSLSTFSYAQKPISAQTENNIPLTQIQLEPSAPSIITEGFEAYCSGQNKNPLAIWSQHMTPILNDIINFNKLGESLMNFTENLLGQCIGYSVIGSHPLTEKTQVIYIESDHEFTPLFWKFLVYRSPKGLVISDWVNNTSASEIIPQNILIGG